ncbi:hypothetical protein EV175_003241 [Coemansia sp. RSA 1933]|nr:hypothetical protein EV175_003241 [Coemansia sp. RSA 1933]
MACLFGMGNKRRQIGDHLRAGGKGEKRRKGSDRCRLPFSGAALGCLGRREDATPAIALLPGALEVALPAWGREGVPLFCRSAPESRPAFSLLARLEPLPRLLRAKRLPCTRRLQCGGDGRSANACRQERDVWGRLALAGRRCQNVACPLKSHLRIQAMRWCHAQLPPPAFSAAIVPSSRF